MGSKWVPGGLRKGKGSKGGRNGQGVRTVRHRGGGVKQSRRRRIGPTHQGGVGRVRGIQYTSGRTGMRARRKVMSGYGGVLGQEYVYVLAVEGRKVGDVVKFGRTQDVENQERKGEQRRGSVVKRGDLPEGTRVSNVLGKYRRAGGKSGQLRGKSGGKYSGRARIRREGGKRRVVPETGVGTVGVVMGKEETRKVAKSKAKAGRMRRRGWRPVVRGEAMNPVDHPHGGRTRGGRPEVTPWGRRAKGVPTVKHKKKS